MANRCLNKVMLIGNLTRDPELRYTPGGVAVASFSVATNRRWTTQSGEQKEDAQFHRIVAWSKLAELCSQLLVKGRRVYVEGRLQHKEWVGSDGGKRKDAEIIISDMIILDSRQAASQEGDLEQELEKATGSDLPEKAAVKQKPKEEPKEEIKKETKEKPGEEKPPF